MRALLAGESRAYGFTIAFWGSGAMLIKAHGLPGLETALAYGIGAVLGFGILSLAAFGRAYREVEYKTPTYAVLGMIHYIAALLPIYLTYLILAGPFSEIVEFVVSGFAVSTTFNLMAMVEEDIAELVNSFS